MIILLGALDVGVEAGIWSVQDAERFVALSTADRCLRILVEMTSDDPVEASNEAARVLAILQADGPDLPILLHGENGSAWSMIDEAARLGVSTRIGFEDVLTGPDGKLADNNAALVEAAAARVLCTVPDRNGGQSRRRD